MNSKKAKKIAAAAVSCALGAMMCFSFTACGPENQNNPSNDYLKESELSASGLKSGFTEEKGKFYSDFDTLTEAHQAGKRLNERIEEEGIVMLKNADNALPLNRDERSVTLFGVKTVAVETGGGGSGAGRPGGYGIPVKTIQASMEDAGFTVNKKVLSLYEQNIAAMSYSVTTAGSSQTLTHELPLSYYSDMITKTYGSFNDAAIITFSRTGAEGYDLLMHDIPGHSDKTDHILQLSDAEKDLIKHAKANFNKVIVLINSSNIMEVGELNDEKTADNLGVDAILHIGHVGNDGAAAIGRVLNGEVNPSGHTVDIWSRDFKKDPSWTNFGDNVQNGQDNDMYLNGEKTGFHSVEYREDIYMGYRYYETVATDKNAAEAGTGDSWYSENVVYPFGYGLSYTSFKWELDEKIAPEAVIEKANGTVTMKVKVTNTGDTAGKDVVQIYASQPYTPGGIEKASSVLVGFEKTKLLKPGESQTLTVKFAAQDMASFDWQDKNNNGFVGYELEAGDYIISACRDSHTVEASVKRTVKETIKCDTDLQTGNKIEAVFSQTDGIYADYNSTNDALLNNLLSREGGLNGTVPAASTKEDRTVSQAFVDMINGWANHYSYEDKATDPWYVSSVPAGWKQAASHEADYSDVTVKISAMAGVDYNDPTVNNGVATAATDEGTKKWDAFMNQLTWEEMCQIVSQGSYGRPAVESIGKPFETDIDGPAQIAWFGNVQVNNYYPDSDKAEWPDGIGTNWVTAVVLASTWNVGLAEEQGLQVGNESILTNSPGWYGPSLNTHRSPLGGRNFEYYSEDGVLGGAMAAAVTLGATSKGVVCYAKHMFLNDQETNRDTNRGLFTYATEQAIREIYLKPFEAVIKTGRTLGTMAASNRIGNWVAFGNYALHNAILRGEWGYKGCNETDSMGGKANKWASINHLIRNGVDLPLGVGSPIEGHSRFGNYDCEYYLEESEWNAQENMVYVKSGATDTGFTMASPTQYYNVRKAAQHMLYVSANSNGINNGITNVSDTSLSFDALQNVNQLIIEPDKFGASAYDSVKIESGALPAGLELSVTGMLTGKPAQSGTFAITVSLRGDGWVKKTANVVITVGNYFTFDGSLNVSAGDTVSGTFGCDKIKLGDTLTGSMAGFTLSGPVASINYTSNNLPEGLTITDGTLSGTVNTAGTYEFSVTMTATAYANLYGMTLPVSQTFVQTYKITVS